MTTIDPQFMYMILVLPSIFGLVLMGDGFNKVIHEEWEGIISMIFGFIFVGLVVFAFLFFSSYLSAKAV